MSNKIQNPNVQKKEVNSDQKKTNIEYRISNKELLMSKDGSRFTVYGSSIYSTFVVS